MAWVNLKEKEFYTTLNLLPQRAAFIKKT